MRPSGFNAILIAFNLSTVEKCMLKAWHHPCWLTRVGSPNMIGVFPEPGPYTCCSCSGTCCSPWPTRAVDSCFPHTVDGSCLFFRLWTITGSSNCPACLCPSVSPRSEQASMTFDFFVHSACLLTYWILLLFSPRLDI